MVQKYVIFDASNGKSSELTSTGLKKDNEFILAELLEEGWRSVRETVLVSKGRLFWNTSRYMAITLILLERANVDSSESSMSVQSTAVRA